MKNNSIWKKFEKSGSIKDYLEYACTSEDAVTGEYAENIIDEELNDLEKDCDDYDRIRLF